MKKLNSNNPKFFDNTEQNHIIVTPCKLDNLLRDFEEGKKYKTILYISIGIFLPVLITLVTCNFHDFFGIPKAGWQGAFIVLLIASFIATFYFGYKIKKGHAFSRDELTDKLLLSTRKKNFMAKKKTSLKVAKVASKQLRSKKTSKPAKTTAASTLSQREKGRKKK